MNCKFNEMQHKVIETGIMVGQLKYLLNVDLYKKVYKLSAEIRELEEREAKLASLDAQYEAEYASPVKADVRYEIRDIVERKHELKDKQEALLEEVNSKTKALSEAYNGILEENEKLRNEYNGDTKNIVLTGLVPLGYYFKSREIEEEDYPLEGYDNYFELMVRFNDGYSYKVGSYYIEKNHYLGGGSEPVITINQNLSYLQLEKLDMIRKDSGESDYSITAEILQQMQKQNEDTAVKSL